ncbi:MAG: ThiF family adenylyltransferase [Myxococcales bacterium]|nr:ThiF family adenylyltransferase [Myxococcales bacterium]
MTTTPTSDRYARQIRFAAFGQIGQDRLRASTVALMGCGALGSHQAETLARAGVGRLLLIDRDVLTWSNLQRQSLYDEAQVLAEMPKAYAAAQRIRQINREVDVEPLAIDLDHRNIHDIVQRCDLLLDGTDNMETRYLINEACIRYQKPWVYGACVGAHGQVATFLPNQGPCFACLFPQNLAPQHRQTCETTGVIAPIVATVAAIQTTEAIKILTQHTEACHQGLLHIDLWEHRYLPMRQTHPRQDCPTCQQHQHPFLEGKGLTQTTTLCGRTTVQIRPPEPMQLDFEQLAQRLDAFEKVSINPYFLRIQHKHLTLHIFADGRALCHGTSDPTEARTLYTQSLGL